jgi:DNA-binding NarL/FixJ family response regulator
MNAEVPLWTVPPLRILLVDDFHPFRQTLERMLKPFPSLYLIGEAADGLSAVEMALALRPDIIVMDVQMPALDGIEATRRIKGSLPQIWVIGMSALDHPMINEAMLAAGASAFVPKYCALTLPQVIEKITGRCLGDHKAG